MNLKKLMSPNRIIFNMKAGTKEEAIDELIDTLDKDGKLYDRERFKKAVLEREAQFSTGIGMGVAIPHGKDGSVKEPAVTFGVSKKGIDFDAPDGSLAHMIFLISVPDRSDNIHLKALTIISRRLMHSNVRKSLMNSKSYEDVINAFDD